MNTISLISVAELLDGRRFFIPAYQRGYRWSEAQMFELLDDRIYIGIDRIKAISRVIECGYTFLDDNDSYIKYGDVRDDYTINDIGTSDGIWLSKELTPYHELEIAFMHDGRVFFCIEQADEDLGELFPDKVGHGDYDFCIGESNVESEENMESFINLLHQLEGQIISAFPTAQNLQ